MDNKGTIAYIGAFELPDKNAAAHRVVNNSKIFKALGYNTVFFGITKDDCASKKVYDFGIDYAQIYPRSAKMWMKRLFDVSCYEEVLNKIDDLKLVILYDVQYATLIKMRKYCTRRKILIIADQTEWKDEKISKHLSDFVRWIDIKLTMYRGLKKLDGMIVVSRYLQDYYNRLTTVYLPPLIDIQDKLWAIPPKEQPKKEKVSLVYSGSPGRTKDNLPQIVNSLYCLCHENDFCLNILGLNKDSFLSLYSDVAELNNQIAVLGDRIRFHGLVSHEISIQMLKNSDWTLIIRNKTRKNMAGFPTKFVEAKTAGVSMIVSDISNVKEYLVDDFRSILVDESITITDAMQKAIHLGQSSNMVCDVFDYRKYISDVREFFKLLGLG